MGVDALVRKVLDDVGIRKERYDLEWASAAEAPRFVKLITDFIGPAYDIDDPRGLETQQYKKCLEEIARELKKKLNADYAWKGNSLRFKRSGASGRIDLGDDYIEIKIKLSMVLAPMKGKIETTLKDKLNLALRGDDVTKFT